MVEGTAQDTCLLHGPAMRAGKARLQGRAVCMGALLNLKGEMWAWDENAVYPSQAFPGGQQEQNTGSGDGGQSAGC